MFTIKCVFCRLKTIGIFAKHTENEWAKIMMNKKIFPSLNWFVINIYILYLYSVDFLIVYYVLAACFVR